MKIGLINPPHLPGHQPRYKLPPLGLLYIAAFLKEKGHETLVYDAEGGGMDIKEIKIWILEYEFDIIGIYCMSVTVPVVHKMVNFIKKFLPNVKIVLGGPHICAVKGNMIKHNPNIDFLIYGEGEYPFYKLISELEDKRRMSEVPNLIYKNRSDKITVNSIEGEIENLDILPYPDLDLIDNVKIKEYGVPYAHFSNVTSVMAMRGCPYNCTFCGVNVIFGDKVKFRSPRSVVKEMEYMNKRYDIDYFVMKDSTFTLNRRWAVEFCEQLKKISLGVRWRCNTRVDHVDKKLLELMKSAGCSCIGFGIESIDNNILSNLKKDITYREMKKTMQWMDEVGIETHCTLMVGSPGETRKSIKKTLKRIKELKPDTISCSITRAYPGTKLYEFCLKNSLLEDPQWYRKIDYKTGDTFLEVPSLKGTIKTNLDLEKNTEACIF